MGDEWGDIDGGWENVDVSDKKKRTRARGKQQRRITAAEVASKQKPPKPKKRPPRPTGAEVANATAPEKAAKPWLLPLVALLLAIVIFGLALLASS